MESREHGSFKEWNKVWEGEVKIELLNPHFTLKEPANLLQFWQKIYSYDLIKLIEFKEYSTFCELGSGRGTTTMYLANHGYTDLTMVDLAENSFKIAEYSFEKYNLHRPKMILADVEKTGLPSDHFDCIYNIGLLEHFNDPSITLKESFRLLKTDGLIFMPIVPALPRYKSYLHRLFFNPISLIKLIGKSILGHSATKSEIYRSSFNKQYYTDICEKIGFKKIRCIAYNPFWKVNGDLKFENNWVLPFYKWYYKTFMKNRNISFSTSSLFEVCYLLIAYK